MAKPTKSGKSRQALSGKALRAFRHDVAALKSKGLVSKNKDARSQKPTRYMIGQVKKYDDVLKGKAKVVTVDTRAHAKELGSNLRVKDKMVVVPVTNKSERVRYDKKRQELVSYGTENGRKLRKVHRAQALDRYDIKTYPRGKNIRYRVPFAHGGSMQFDTPEELFAAMFEYEHKKNPFKNIYDFVQIVYVEDDDEDSEE